MMGEKTKDDNASFIPRPSSFRPSEIPGTQPRQPVIHEPVIHEPHYVRKVVYKHRHHHRISRRAIAAFALLLLLSAGYAVIYIRDASSPFSSKINSEVRGEKGEGREVKGEGRGVKDEGREMTDEGRVMKDEGREIVRIPAASGRTSPISQPPSPNASAAVTDTDPSLLMIASFNSGKRIDELGGNFLAFTSAEEPLVCRDFFNADNARLGNGYALKIQYNVDAPQYVENGIRIDTADLPLEGYTALSLYIKGDMIEGFSSTVVCELIGDKTKKLYKLSNVTERWEHVVLPLEVLRSENARLREIRITVRNDVATEKTGVFYLDDVGLVRE